MVLINPLNWLPHEEILGLSEPLKEISTEAVRHLKATYKQELPLMYSAQKLLSISSSDSYSLSDLVARYYLEWCRTSRAEACLKLLISSYLFFHLILHILDLLVYLLLYTLYLILYLRSPLLKLIFYLLLDALHLLVYLLLHLFFYPLLYLLFHSARRRTKY
jgi:hypothetical protein